MCKKCQDACPTCQDRLKNYREDELYECLNCGHLFPETEMKGSYYCLDCYELLRETADVQTN